MLSLTEIEGYYPENLRTFKRNILREYLQYKILQIIFNSPLSNKLSFLGGTNLRIVHGNSRFSEDLDFDNFDLQIEDFEKLSKLIQKELMLEGYQVEIRNVFKGAYRCYIKFPAILYENNLSGLEEEKILIQLDSAPHGFNYVLEKFMLNKFDVFTTILTTPMDIILAQKIYAIFNRKAIKGRDFFDVVFLFGKCEPNYDYLTLKLDIKDKNELKERLLEKINGLDFKALARDVRPFLMNSNDVARVEEFENYIKIRLG